MSANLEAAARRFVEIRAAFYERPSMALALACGDAADALAAALPPLVAPLPPHNCPKCADAMECDCPITIHLGPPPDTEGMARLRGLLDRPGAEL